METNTKKESNKTEEQKMAEDGWTENPRAKPFQGEDPGEIIFSSVCHAISQENWIGADTLIDLLIECHGGSPTLETFKSTIEMSRAKAEKKQLVRGPPLKRLKKIGDYEE